jgi:hypothetical protein
MAGFVRGSTVRRVGARDAIQDLLDRPYSYDPAPHVVRRGNKRNASSAWGPSSEATGYHMELSDDDDDDGERKEPLPVNSNRRNEVHSDSKRSDSPLPRGFDPNPDIEDVEAQFRMQWPRQIDDSESGPDLMMDTASYEHLLEPPPEIEKSTTSGGFDGMFDSVLNYFDSKYDEEFKDSRLRRREEHIDSDYRENTDTTGLLRDRLIRKYLNMMGLKRSDLQIRFHNLVLQASAKNIFGTDFDTCQEIIFERNGGKEIRHEILVQTPRRFGKTTMVAMVVAAIAVCVPGIKIAIFSTVQRTSKKLMEEVFRFVTMLPGAAERIGVHNKEELHILPHAVQRAAWGRKKTSVDPNAISIIYSYPASVSGTRGFTVHMILIDEAAHIDENVWKFSIVPALGTEGMVLLALTTAQSVSNFFSKLIALKRNDGENVFETLVLTLVCDACQLAGKQNSCTHRMHLLPSWKPVGRQELIQTILGESDGNVYLQEAMGIILENPGNVFEKALIEKMAKRALYKITFMPDVVYSFIDPAGGGTYSSQAIVSLFTNNRDHVVSKTII